MESLKCKGQLLGLGLLMRERMLLQRLTGRFSTWSCLPDSSDMLIIDDIIGFSEILGHESSIFKNIKIKALLKNYLDFRYFVRLFSWLQQLFGIVAEIALLVNLLLFKKCIKIFFIFVIKLRLTSESSKIKSLKTPTFSKGILESLAVWVFF